MNRLAIITTHPVQYNAPLFRLLSERFWIAVKVFYTWECGAETFDREFGREVKWDLPLLEGYDHVFVSNGGNRNRGFRDVRNATLEQDILDWGATAVLVYGWNYRSHLRAMRYFNGRIPVYFRGDSTLLDPLPSWKKVLRGSWLRYVYSLVDKAFYVGTRNMEYYLEMGVPETGLVYAPHAVDNERFAAGAVDHVGKAAAMRRSMGIGEKDKVVLFAAKFIPKKDPGLLVQAWKQLRLENAHLVLVGDGELLPLLQKASADDPRIHILPFQNQQSMPAVYLMGDVFCLPSKGPGETWGLAVNEAMACGRPLLVSDMCGCAVDLVLEGVNGYRFRSGDVQGLASRLEKMLIQDDLYSMGKASFHHIRGFSHEAFTRALESELS
jgi:glycosyltransferase involved in cell wall biosynthesis